MNKWILKLSVMLLTCGGLSAYYNSCDSCQYDPCSAGAGFEAEIDFIYWKPCLDDMDFASQFAVCEEEDSITFDFHYKDACPKWKPGVRARLAIRDFLCNLTLRGSYTYLKMNQENCLSCGCDCQDEGECYITSPLLHPFLSYEFEDFFTNACAKWDSSYQAGDALFTFPICCNPCYNVMPFFGVAGINFDQKLDIDLTCPAYEENVSANIFFKGDYWGVGLKIGSDFEYNVLSCVKLFGNGSLSLLAGERCSKNSQCLHYSYDDEDITVKNKGETIVMNFRDDNSSCHVVPGYQIQTGLRYFTCLCNCNVRVHIGYEFVTWHNLPQARRFTEDQFPYSATVSTSSSKRELAFHGLFVGAHLGF